MWMGTPFMLCSWVSWGCWVRRLVRVSHTCVRTQLAGWTAPPSATNMHCASEEPTQTSWHNKTHTIYNQHMMAARYIQTHTHITHTHTQTYMHTYMHIHSYHTHSLLCDRCDVVLCVFQGRSGQDQTVLLVDAPHTDVLPLMDVSVMDFGKSKQKFGFSVGSVCFNG